VRIKIPEGELEEIKFNQQRKPTITITVKNFIVVCLLLHQSSLPRLTTNQAEENHSFATIILTFNADFFE
jgi:hypothetical protein